ncbi:hypothetical protein LTR62_003013 [Meristemomyces frigidus]|uniref:Uncharacterized protein n=1 Tax=Meristemomyces frigidus TaxID=1508187 RepID=A0AAN7TRW1_9PEZI|nr:hypothetical protein LTR62_003013 [Meristemomyces frigidus]
MAQKEQKYILSAGFGRFASTNAAAQALLGPNPGETALKLLQASVTEAKAAGFIIESEDMNPADVKDSLVRFTARLREREWMAVNIGYGVRGVKENTVLFERLLEAVREVRPGAKLVFSNAPDEIVPAIRRNFPGDFDDAAGS